LRQRPRPEVDRQLLRDQKLEILHEHNTEFDQDGNWRLRINSSGDLVLEVRSSGTWTIKDTWLA
jgi:hypothetical protein